MKRDTSIQLKAVFLFTVFALNTGISFACSVGVEMGFNSKSRHSHEAMEEHDHVHKNGKKHQHHNEATETHHNSKKDSEKGCCNDKAINFQHLDKCLTQMGNTGINVPVVAIFPGSFLDNDSFKLIPTPPLKYLARFFHPPPPDIGILNQRFQI